MPSLDAPRRVAVIGSGVSGLTAAYVLERSGVRVTLFEKDPRLGGHADTHDVLDGRGRTQQVDTGFIVHNEETYPVLMRLFGELGVATQPSDMSMSVRCDECGLEYAGGKGLPGLLATRRSGRPAYLRMLREVVRFHRRARALLDGPEDEQTLEQFLDAGSFSTYFRAHFMTPLVAAVWSCPPDTAGRYPARYLFAFMSHHGMLTVTGSPQWRTVVGGSRSYVEKLAKHVTSIHTSTSVVSVRRRAPGVEIWDADDEVHRFDGAVIATHPHQALALLADPTSTEASVLGAINYTHNPTLLHTDVSLLPSSDRAQASWNYVMNRCSSDASSVLVSYDMNRLQSLEATERFVVTLNGGDRVDPTTVIAKMDYEHPSYTPESVGAQRMLPALSDGLVAFAGAYHGWGFHEDGARSGVEAALALGSAW